MQKLNYILNYSIKTYCWKEIHTWNTIKIHRKEADKQIDTVKSFV